MMQMSTTFPSTFTHIDELKSAGAMTGTSFGLDASKFRDIARRPCWETALLQWLWTEVDDRSISILQSPDSTISAHEQLAKIRDSLCGAALCLLPAEFYSEPKPSAVIGLRTELVAQQDNWPDLASKGAAFAICADHLISPRKAKSKLDEQRQYKLPRRLYPEQMAGIPADWGGFNSLVSDLVRSVCAKPMQPVWFEPSHETAIPTILHELFKNTHDHGRTLRNGSAPKYSLRGIACNYFELGAFKYIGISKSTNILDPASAYVREFLDARNRKGRVAEQSSRIEGFLELSIFDSGPGLVGRAAPGNPDSLSSQEQLEIVKQCLRVGFSSTDNELRGYGLSKVIARLKRSKGFIRIRTNGVSGYRSFARFSDLSIPALTEGDFPDDRLLDWRNLYSPVQTPHRNLKGTVVTVLLPMGGVDAAASNS
jgi:hypothetical protein